MYNYKLIKKFLMDQDKSEARRKKSNVQKYRKESKNENSTRWYNSS